ncbi:CBO0543 family protein [Ureibacillus aquaedulcis]|uniref:CBO0543 family protein n=1 Tax=Ureibacillus aquaedulcis TaxID=3058421 RepID=A0ABT8GRS8_9BACL|nr:CBO0543 family protein [Ureibacillus sp. BA0131]MDN4494120.1 CBO0543 family protein [Ureibacillus sp. BA0131]
MTYQEGLNQIDKATEKITDANQLTTDMVMNVFLFTWQWWVALAMMVIPWVIWLILRDRKSSARIFSAGLLLMVLSEILDAIGVSYGKWAYPVKVIPVATVSFSFRLSLLPVFAMLLLQFKPRFNPFIKAIFFGASGAYVGLPLLAMMDLYKKIDWSLTYSFLILTSIYLLAHWYSRRNSFEEISENNGDNH